MHLLVIPLVAVVAILFSACGRFESRSCWETKTLKNCFVSKTATEHDHEHHHDDGGGSDGGSESGSGDTGSGNGTGSGSGGQTGGSGNVDVFVIQAGTGTNRPYNTKETRVMTKVGRKLKIVNNDTVAHVIHGGGACPIDHFSDAQALMPGQSREVDVRRAYNPANAVNSPCYRHTSSQAATPLWIEAAP